MPVDPSSPPPPRLCHVTKWPDFDGYGFNLHAEKNKPGQFIGKIDPGSPALKAGLKEGDRVVEVNGVNVNMENHKQVVSRIKAVPGETRLLVADKECEEWHKEHRVTLHANLPYVSQLSSSHSPRPEQDEDTESCSDREVSTSSSSSDREEEQEEEEDRIDTRLQTLEPEGQQQGQEEQTQSERKERKDTTGERPSPGVDTPDLGLNLNMTAKEMRQRLGSQKRKDPRKESSRLDVRRKVEMVQAL